MIYATKAFSLFGRLNVSSSAQAELSDAEGKLQSMEQGASEYAASESDWAARLASLQAMVARAQADVMSQRVKVPALAVAALGKPDPALKRCVSDPLCVGTYH